MPYPTYLDLKAFLDSKGLACPTTDKQTLKDTIAVAIQDFEDETGWHPFLGVAGEEPEEKTIDGPEGSIIFPAFGIISLDSLSVDGTEYTANTHYWLQFQIPNGPYRGIEVDGYVTGHRRIITLAGVFGYTLTLPTKAKVAILSKAAMKLYASITGQEGDIKREKQGPVEFEYQNASNAYNGKKGELQQAWDEAIKTYKRVTL